MNITYRTTVLHVPPTPLGLLPADDVIWHRCDGCGQRVENSELVAHAQAHRHDGREGRADSAAVHNGRRRLGDGDDA
jgi:hypothetical protein